MKESIFLFFYQRAKAKQNAISIHTIRSHVIPMLWAAWCFRRAAHLGRMARLWGWPSIQVEGTLWIGDRVRLVSTTATLELVVKKGGLLKIGDGTYINYGGSIAVMERVQIGANCLIGPHVMISDNQFHCLEPEHRFEIPPSAPVTLNNDVWLGGRVIILPGVTIGEGSVIGAGSVVTRDIPPRSVAVGAPARVVKTL